jgi:hypothetical protein
MFNIKPDPLNPPDRGILNVRTEISERLLIRLGSLPERPYPILPLIGEGMSKILGKNFLPAILLFPSPHEERDRERSFCKERNLPSRILPLFPISGEIERFCFIPTTFG